MTSPEKRKGDAFERLVIEELRRAGFPYVERRPAGATIDLGDVVGFGLPVVIECRARREPRLPAWAVEAEAKAEAGWPGDPDALGVVVAKRFGHGSAADATVAMTMGTFMLLLKCYAIMDRNVAWQGE